jgi:hypothetical protein
MVSDQTSYFFVRHLIILLVFESLVTLRANVAGRMDCPADKGPNRVWDLMYVLAGTNDRSEDGRISMENKALRWSFCNTHNDISSI